MPWRCAIWLQPYAWKEGGGRGEGGGAVMAAGARVVARAVVEKVV